MMRETDSNVYFRRRAAQEIEAARRAADERSARLHRALAREFERRAEEGFTPVRDDAPASILPNEFRILP